MDYRILAAQPRPEIQTRDLKYALEMVKYFYGFYADNQLQVGLGGLHQYSSAAFKELRDHGKGVQDIQQYRDRVDPPRRKGDERKYNATISWRISDQYQRYRNILKSKFQELILTPRIDATSNEAVMERNYLKNLQQLVLSPEMQEFMKGADYNMPQTTQTPDEVGVLDQLGGIKLEREIVAKDVADAVLRNSGVESLIPLWIEDLIDIALCASDFKVINGLAQFTYVDPATLIIPRDYHEDFRTGDFRGYWEYPTVAEIKAQYPNVDVSQLKKFEGVLWNWGEKVNFAQFGRAKNCVKVVTMYWIEYDEQPYVVGIRPNGARQFEKVTSDFNLSKRAQEKGKKLEKYVVQRMYKARWVVGTDQILEFGPVDIMARGRDRMYWPLNIVCTQSKSATESVMPFNDELQIDIFKLRILKSKIAPGPRMVIYKDMIMDSVDIGGDSFTIKDLMNLYQTEGIMVLDRNPDFLEGQQQLKPIEFIPSGVLEDFKILQESIIGHIANIRAMTGMNELVDGATPDMLKTVALGLQQATNSIIRPLLTTYVNFYKSMIKYVVLRQQQAVLAFGEQEFGVKREGTELTIVSAGRDFGKEEFLVDVQVETQDMKNFILQSLMERKDMIPPESYLSVIRAIEQNDLTKAQVILLLSISRAEQQAHKRQIEIQQAVAQGNAQAGVAVEQARMNTEKERILAEMEMKKQELAMEFEMYMKKFPFELQMAEKKAAMSHAQAVDVVERNNQNRLSQ